MHAAVPGEEEPEASWPFAWTGHSATSQSERAPPGSGVALQVALHSVDECWKHLLLSSGEFIAHQTRHERSSRQALEDMMLKKEPGMLKWTDRLIPWISSSKTRQKLE